MKVFAETNIIYHNYLFTNLTTHKFHLSLIIFLNPQEFHRNKLTLILLFVAQLVIGAPNSP